MIKMLLVAVSGLASVFGLSVGTFIIASLYCFAGCLTVVSVTCISVLADVLYFECIRGKLHAKV